MTNRQDGKSQRAKALSIASLAIALFAAVIWFGTRPSEKEAQPPALMGNDAGEVSPAAEPGSVPVATTTSTANGASTSRVLQDVEALSRDGNGEGRPQLPMQGPVLPMVKIRGRVVDEQGLPITTFRVASTDPDHRSGPHREEPDFGNSFELQTRREGRWSLQVMAEGYLTSRSSIEVPFDKELVVVLKLAGNLTVRVVDSLLEPVAGAEVRTQPAGSGMRPDWHRTPTDANGEVRWTDLALGRLYVIADHEGWGVAVSDAIELGPGQLDQEVLLTLTPGGEIFGVARGQRGLPERGLELRLRRRATTSNDPLRAFGRILRTGAEGEFSFTGIPEGNYTITSGKAANPNKSMVTCSVDATVLKGERVAVELVLADEEQVEVTGVVLRDGFPFAGALVRPRHLARSGASLVREAYTDQAGRFALTLPHGGLVDFGVSEQVWAGGCSITVSQTGQVPSEGEFELRMEYRTGSIRGRVVDSSGAEQAGVSVTASASGQEVAGGLSRSYASTRTDEGGVFLLSPLAVGTYSVAADGGRSEVLFRGEASLERVEVQGATRAEGIVLTLGRALELATIRGHVTGPGGAPSVAARIEIRSQTRTRSERSLYGITTDSGGAYLLQGLVGSSFRMRSVRESQTSDWVLVEAQAGEEVTRDFVLEPGAFLPVRFTEVVAGQGVFVSVSDAEGRSVASQYTEQSFARLGPLIPGDYTVTARVVMRNGLPDPDAPRGTAEVVFELDQANEKLIELH